MFTTVYSGFGFWDVSAWLVFFCIASFYALWIRSMGRKDYKKGTEQDEIFWSGNPVPEDGEDITVPASAAYWGYKKAFAPFYKALVAFHSGVTTDYAGWFIVVSAVICALAVIF